jgi:hypothetical protein
MFRLICGFLYKVLKEREKWVHPVSHLPVADRLLNILNKFKRLLFEIPNDSQKLLQKKKDY